MTIFRGILVDTLAFNVRLNKLFLIITLIYMKGTYTYIISSRIKMKINMTRFWYLHLVCSISEY